MPAPPCAVARVSLRLIAWRRITTMKHGILAVIILVDVLLQASASGDWLIVPGKRIGKVTIGMEQADVIGVLGVPHHQEDLEETQRNGSLMRSDTHHSPMPVLKGVLQNDWITPLALAKDLEEHRPLFMHDFVTVYIRNSRAVQIEVRSSRFKTVDGVSTAASAAKLRKHYPRYKETVCRYRHPSSGGIPAANHFVIYEDAVSDGIAWRYGGFGNLADGGVS